MSEQPENPLPPGGTAGGGRWRAVGRAAVAMLHLLLVTAMLIGGMLLGATAAIAAIIGIYLGAGRIDRWLTDPPEVQVQSFVHERYDGAVSVRGCVASPFAGEAGVVRCEVTTLSNRLVADLDRFGSSEQPKNTVSVVCFFVDDDLLGARRDVSVLGWGDSEGRCSQPPTIYD
jgi:hypothetical protein